MALIITSSHFIKLQVQELEKSRTKILDIIPQQLRTNQDSLINTRIIMEVSIASKVGVGSRSAIYRLQSSGAHRVIVIIAARDLSTTIIHDKVSPDMILLTIVYCKSSLNQVELLDSGHFIQDDSSPSKSKGVDERNCVTNSMPNHDKFVSTPTSVFSCQDNLDVSRQSFTKADSSELSLNAFNIASTNGFCLQQRLINVAIQIFAWVYCSDLDGSEQNVVVQGGTMTTIFTRHRYISVVCLATALQECTLDIRDEPNTRTDIYIAAEVDNISRVIKKQKVKCDKFPS